MKRNLLFLFIVVLTGCLAVSCGGKQENAGLTSATNDTETAPDEGADPQAPEETVEEIKPFTIDMILEKGASAKEMPSFKKLSEVKTELEGMGYTFEHVKKGKVIIVPDEDGDAMKVKADVDRFTKDGTTVEFATTPEKDEWHVTFDDKEELSQFLDNAKDFGFKATGKDLYNWQGAGEWSYLWIFLEGKTAIIGYGE